MDDAAASSMRGADSATNASAISFGFAATAVLVSMFLLMAIFEHLIKPGLASSSSRGSRSHDDDDGDDDIREGRGHGRRLGLPPARQRERDASPDKLSHSPKVRTILIPDVSLPQCHCSVVVLALHCHCSRRALGSRVCRATGNVASADNEAMQCGVRNLKAARLDGFLI
jgi:hypothetical protein